jgi:hypothetical protein
VHCSPHRLHLVRIAALAALGAAACATAPRAGPLTGLPVARALPPADLPPGYRRITFRWEYRERVFSARGDGAARIAPPDSVRLDFFLENGASGGFVILIADSLRLEVHDQVRRSVPPVPLLWAALGRVSVAAPDTVVYVDGDTLRADVGRDPVWRLTYGRDALVRMERLRRDRIEETIERTDSTRVVYRQPGTGRALLLTVLGRFAESRFDETIWRR